MGINPADEQRRVLFLGFNGHDDRHRFGFRSCASSFVCSRRRRSAADVA
jgi:hypothetical protein